MKRLLHQYLLAKYYDMPLLRARGQFCFVRSTFRLESEVVVQERPEVDLFGDVSTYQTLTRLLCSSLNRPIWLVNRDFKRLNTIAALLLPPCPGRGRRLLLVERPVVLGTIQTMELVLYGTRRAYRWLADSLQRLIHVAEDSSEHLHADEYQCDFIIRGSVYLVMRAPVKKFNRASLEHWGPLVFGHPSRLPADLDAQDITGGCYTPITGRGDPDGPLDRLWCPLAEGIFLPSLTRTKHKTKRVARSNSRRAAGVQNVGH